MKSSQFIALLKYPGHASPLFSILIGSYICGLLFACGYHFSLNLYPLGLALFLIPPIAVGYVFRSSTKEDQAFENLEFLFSRAINRTSLYYVKAALYLAIILLPLITGWAYDFTTSGEGSFPPFTLALAFTSALLIQVVIFVFPPILRGPLLFAIMFIAVLSASCVTVIAYYKHEEAVAWINQHGVLTLPVLALLTVLVQRYCCRRFVNREITS
jgi:DNA-directed RNA polymerase subunit N (RpoN/RPB10)